MTSVKHALTVSATINLDEGQLRALDALAGYDTDEFLKAFYENLGKSYLKPHEGGLRRLFTTIRQDIPPALYDVDEARKLLKGKGAK